MSDGDGGTSSLKGTEEFTQYPMSLGIPLPFLQHNNSNRSPVSGTDQINFYCTKYLVRIRGDHSW